MRTIRVRELMGVDVTLAGNGEGAFVFAPENGPLQVVVCDETQKDRVLFCGVGRLEWFDRQYMAEHRDAAGGDDLAGSAVAALDMAKQFNFA